MATMSLTREVGLLEGQQKAIQAVCELFKRTGHQWLFTHALDEPANSSGKNYRFVQFLGDYNCEKPSQSITLCLRKVEKKHWK